MNRAYLPRLKQAIIESGNPGLFPQLTIPRSTTSGWIRNGVSEVVTIKEAEFIDQKSRAKKKNIPPGRPSLILIFHLPLRND